MAYYTAVDADGHPRLFGCRFGKKRRGDAEAKADRLGGYLLRGWTAVYCSPAYLEKHPLNTGGGGVGSMERVEPPRGMFTDGAYARFVSDNSRGDWAET